MSLSNRLSARARIIQWLDKYYALVCRKEATKLERQRRRAIEDLDRQVGRAARYGCLNTWRKARVEDMYRYVNQYKWLPLSYFFIFDSWVEEAICLRDDKF